MLSELPIRKIIHIDMDAFYASVEQMDNPKLRNLPLAVGGSGKRGVVSAASYEARKFGVRSAISGVLAKKLCPGLIFVSPRFDRYKEISSKVHSIFLEYSDLVEPLSLDGAYIDVTENKKGIESATLIAKEIRNKIETKIGLTASAGISINKFVAKVASDYNKPNGQKTVPPEEVISFVGDGSYLLNNTDIYSSVITKNKLIIIVCDNGGFAVINRLQLFNGGKEYNNLLKSSNTPGLVDVDFAKHAESMGAKSEHVNSISDLEAAFKRAKASDVTYVISIKTHAYKWVEGSAFWDSPTLEIPTTKENEEALKLYKEGKGKQRQGV